MPVAFYPFRSKPLLETFSLGDDDRNYLDFSCRSSVLGTMHARDFESSRNIVARLCLPLMARDPDEKLRMIVRAYEGMLELEPDFGKRIKYSEFIGMYARLDKEEELLFRSQYADASPFKEDIMSLTDIWQEQGEVRGIEKGKLVGKREGEAIGRVKAIVQLYADGILSAEQARTQLHALTVKSNVPQSLVDDALLEIKN